MDSSEFRTIGHQVVDRLAAYFESIDRTDVFHDVAPAKLHALFDEAVPQKPSSSTDVLRQLDHKLLPYCTNVGAPGYFGLITPSPNLMGILGDFICSALNQNIGAYSIGPSAVAMERRTVRWLCDIAGYGPEAGGNLTSGGMMANFVALKLARDWASGDAAQHDGVSGPWAVYTSEERHVSVDKAVDCVGLGRRALRALPTDNRFSLRLDALEDAIAEDKRNAIRPMCIVAMFGSTNTGSLDDLRALRRIADRERMWLHADAAYGGGMLLSRATPFTGRGLELADSITIDPHKWFYAPLDAGAVLVKDERRLTSSFGMQPAYLTDEFDKTNERYQYFVHSFEQSRRFRGLKVWMSFKRYGARQIGEWVDANVAHARRLYELAQADSDFEPATEPPMSAICLRYRGANLRGDAKKFHADVVSRIEKDGRFWISTTELKGKSYFRINPVNFRTRAEHMDELFATLQRECRS
ncbi:MAG TPA: pyridoxal-dependent decarboxylase [Terriglobales bacterium]|nr:pyridoxal-dependent decarboxylase [Terriglobales bacterium]